MPQEPTSESLQRSGRFAGSMRSSQGQSDPVAQLQRFAAAEQARKLAPPPVAPSQGFLSRMFGGSQPQQPVMQQQAVAPSQGFLSRIFGGQQDPVAAMQMQRQPGSQIMSPSNMGQTYIPQDFNLPVPTQRPAMPRPIMMPRSM